MPFDTYRSLCIALSRTFILVLGLVIMGVGTTFAQGTIEGNVTAQSSDDPLPGVNVAITELQIGAATGVDGNFAITDVPPGEHTVRARFVGYQTRTKTVEISGSETVTLNFRLPEATRQMDEVVVTGTGGAAERKEIGNSISQVGAEEIEAAPGGSFGDVLQGRVSGANIMDNSGQVGGGRSIRLRGNSSATQDNTPLIYVDGVRMNNGSVGGDPEVNQAASPMDDINPEDIERVEVIKGPAATTLYGTEASSGVIQIFTKEGSQGNSSFTFTTKQGANHMGQIGTQEYHSELAVNDCSDEPSCPSDGDWLRTGHIQQYNLSVRGGTGTVNYFVSGKVSDESGIISPQGSNRYSVRGNFGFNPLESLNVKINNNYTRRNITWLPDGNNAEGFLLNSLRGDRGYTPDGDDSEVLAMDLTTTIDHFTSSIDLNWSPTTNLSQSLNLGLDYTNSEYEEEKPFGYFLEQDGARENDSDVNRRVTADYQGSYETEIAGNFSSTTSWGGQLFRDLDVNLNGTGEDFSGPGDKVLDNGAVTRAFESRLTETSGGFFAQERLGWNEQLFITLGLRVDGHSTFGENFGLAPYPKASFSYLVSESNFWPDWWGTMKLRGAYGESGRAPSAFAAIRTYESTSGDEGEPAVTPGNIGDPDLGPERSREFEGGFEASFFEDRISASFTAYRQRTYDALVDVQPTPSNGFTDTQLRNVGEFENRGIELDLDTDVIRTEAVTWRLGGSYSTNFTEAIETGPSGDIYVGWNNEIKEGEPIPAVYRDVVKNPDQIPDDPQNVEFEERNLGTSYAPQTLNLNTSVTLWEDLTLEVLGQGKFGHVLSSGTAYQNVRREKWPTCNDIQAQINNGDYSGLTAGQIGRCDPDQTTYGMWTRAADYFKLRSLSLQYRVPDQYLPGRLRNASLRFQGRNLFTITDYPGLDPEAFEDGNRPFALFRQEYYNLPPVRSFTFTLKTNF